MEKHHHSKLLRSLLRRIAIRTIIANRVASMEALLVLIWEPPIELIIEQRIQIEREKTWIIGRRCWDNGMLKNGTTGKEKAQRLRRKTKNLEEEGLAGNEVGVAGKLRETSLGALTSVNLIDIILESENSWRTVEAITKSIISCKKNIAQWEKAARIPCSTQSNSKMAVLWREDDRFAKGGFLVSKNLIRPGVFGLLVSSWRFSPLQKKSRNLKIGLVNICISTSWFKE